MGGTQLTHNGYNTAPADKLNFLLPLNQKKLNLMQTMSGSMSPSSTLVSGKGLKFVKLCHILSGRIASIAMRFKSCDALQDRM